MVKKLLAILSLFLTSNAVAADAVSFKAGIGATTNKRSALFSLDWENEIYGNSFYRIDFGAWTDNEVGHESAPFGSVLVGCRFGGLDSFNITPGMGILVMGYPDSLLGAPFTFTEELAVGYKRVSVGWKHVSNGGLAQPNLGRDYWFFNLLFPLGGL